LVKSKKKRGGTAFLALKEKLHQTELENEGEKGEGDGTEGRNLGGLFTNR